MPEVLEQKQLNSRLETVLHVVAEKKGISYEEMKAQFMAEFQLSEREMVFRLRGKVNTISLTDALEYAAFLGRKVEEIFYID
jgi:hypothetical protein